MKILSKFKYLFFILGIFLMGFVVWNDEYKKGIVLGENNTSYGVGMTSAPNGVDEINGYVYRETVNFPFTGSVQPYTMHFDSYAILEVWGASGGGAGYNGINDSGAAGRGGYSRGELTVSRGTDMFVYVGGAGLCRHAGRSTGGFNGGGYSWSSSTSEPACGGGGGTDIRLYADSLYNRVIVAGGGGGGGEDAADTVGAGGGTNGGNGGNKGGSQTAGGTGAVFGKGAHTPNDGGGGGGGWYGGGTVNGSQTIPKSNSDSDAQGGAGGSGYVWTVSTASSAPSGFALTANDYLSNAKTIAGTSSFTGVNGVAETGHLGNGYARMTIYDKCEGNSGLGYINVNKGKTDTYQKIVGQDDQKIYDIYFGADELSATFEISALESCSTVTSPINNKEVALNPGVTSYNVTIVSSTGDVTVYTIRLHREISDTTYLDAINVDGAKITGYDKDLAKYEIELPYDTFSVTLTADKHNNNQSVEGLGEVSLEQNRVTRNVKVIAENGVATRTYVIEFHRAESTYLKTLTSRRMKFVSNLMPGVYSYKILRADNNKNEYLTYEAADKDATVSVSGDLATDDSITLTVSKAGLESTVYTISKSNAYEYSYTGGPQLFIAPYTAEYRLHVWGAQGGYRSSASYGGKGGYSTGIVYLEKGEKLYVYVGGAGNNGGYNGGGTRQGFPNKRGGGATDMRLVAGDLYTRIIVAGGGGSDGDYNDNRVGGYGGGASGQSKTENYGTGGVGGTQTSAGGNGGKFGVGGPGLAQSGGYGGAGGGGWYGGGGVTPDGSQDDDRGGGGGSGYILTETSAKPAGYKVGEKYYLTSAAMYSGAQTMLAYDLTNTMVGNTGNGYAIIEPTRIMSDNDHLSNITIHAGDKNYPIAFDRETQEYYVTLDAEDSHVHIEATLEDDSAVWDMEGDGDYWVPSGTSDYVISVYAANGNVPRDYVIHFTRPVSSYKYLEDIKINGTSIEGFEPTTLNYIVRLPYYEVSNVTIEGIKARAEQRIVGNDQVEITEGTLAWLIQVYSEDGTKNSIYTITFIVDHSTKLKELQIGNMELSPEFFREQLSYTIQLTENPRDAVYRLIPYDSNATVEMTGDLAAGDNILRIRVSEPHCADTVYTVKASGEYGFDYAGSVRVWTAPVSGIFHLQVWGAQGGYRSNANMGGKGAYAEGNITVTQGTKLYIYVGGSGNAGGQNGGFNGGGYRSNNLPGGGGATDIRLAEGDLYSRVIVAAGGGSDGATGKPGGAGGAENGQSRTESYGSGGAGATQTAGGAGGNGNSGAFGIGGHGIARANGFGGAGGGGWYGGGGVYPDGSADDDRGGGGGSSFAYGHSTTASYPAGYTDAVAERYMLTETKLIGGTAAMPSHDGTRTMTGNTGNGYAKITLIQAHSGDSTLSSLTTSKGTWDQPFNPKVREYTVTLNADDYQVEIAGTPNNETSYVHEGDLGTFDILANEDSRTVMVIAEDGTTTSYVLHFVRAESSYKLLENIFIDGEPITGFAPDKFTYDIHLNFDVLNEVEVTAKYGRPSQGITGTGTIDVSSGTAVVSIEVVSEDGSGVSTYTLTLHKTPSTKLRVLNVGDAFHLNPIFDPYREDTEYDVSILPTTLSLPVEAIPYDGAATVRISGNGYIAKNKDITITVSREGLADTVYTIHVNKTLDDELTVSEFDYTGAYQVFTAHYPGRYQIELWGAQGGYRSTVTNGGKGGYATGVITLAQDEQLYVYVGGSGNTGGVAGGWNGGGSRVSALPGGGGATDVRAPFNQLNPDTDMSYDWNASLNYRFIVAGGGGSDGSGNRPGGYGGGASGESRTQSYGSGGGGGTQTAGGAGSSSARRGSFGQGGNGVYYANGYGGAGGGGWYGGGGVYPDGSVDDDRGGGGGSGFVLTDTATVPSTYALDKLTTETTDEEGVTVTAPNKKYYLEETKLIAGNAKMPNPNGGYTTGRIGNGYAKITLLEEPSQDNFLKKLDINKGEIKTDFDPENPFVLDYTVTLDSEMTEIEIKGYVDSTATITGNGTYKIPAGGYDVPLTIVAENGEVRTYTITFVRSASSTDTVNDISISGFVPSLCSLTPSDESFTYCSYTFDPDTMVYDIYLPRRIKELQFHVVKGHYYEEIVYQNLTTSSLAEDGVVDCTEEETNFTIQIISEDGTKRDRIYTYRIHRDMVGNTDLATLKAEISTETTEGPLIEDLLSGSYDVNIGEYYVTIPREVEGITFTAIADDPRATVTLSDVTKDIDYTLVDGVVTVSGIDALPIGQTDFHITVAAANGETRTYLVSVWHALADNAFLDSMALQNYSADTAGEEIAFTPVFKSTIINYSVTVPNDVTKVLLTPETQSPRATQTIYYESVADENVVAEGTPIALHTGANKIIVVVDAEDGETHSTYTMTINRIKNSNKDLAMLQATGYTMEEEPFDEDHPFDPNLLTYHVTVPASVNALDIYALAAVPETSTVAITGHTNIHSGANTIRIRVTAEDKSYKDYTIIATRELSDTNTLSNLEVKNGSETLALDKTFGPMVTEYAVTVPNEIKSVNVVATLSDARARVVSGSGKSSLVVGDNTIDVVVRSESGIEKTYTVVVTRQPNTNANLSGIQNDLGKSLEEEWDAENRLDYTLIVPKETTQVTLTAIAEASVATVTGNGTYTLNETGDTVATFVVTPEAGDTKTYTVTIRRDLSVVADLKELRIEETTLNETFAADKVSYTATVPNDVTSIHVIAKALSPYAQSVQIDVPDTLAVGPNNVTVTVTPEKGASYAKVYTIVVTREEPAPASNFLRSITTNRGELTPAFESGKMYYTLSVANDITSIMIQVEKEDTNATVVGDGLHTLEEGDNTIAITVTSTDGVDRTYQVVVTRAYSSNAKLQSLQIMDTIMTPSFDPDVEDYYVTTSLKGFVFLDITPQELTSSYVILNNSFETGEHDVIVRVTAPDGVTTKDYTIHVTRNASHNNNLELLEIEDVPFKEAFVKSKTLYYANVTSDINRININAAAEDPYATVTGDGLTSLVAGENIVEVTVTSESGHDKVYTIVVNKALDTNNYIASLTLPNVTLSPTFDRGTQSYTATVPYEIEEINFTAKLESAVATITGDGTHTLTVGENTFTLYVTAENGDVRPYVFTITRERCISPYIASLIVGTNTATYDLSPAFQKLNLDYVVQVDYEVSNLPLQITMEDELATYQIRANGVDIADVANIPLVVGSNEIEITTYDSNHENTVTYVLTVTRAAYTNNFLAYLGLSSGVLSPTFDKYTLDYTVDVAYDVPSITLSGEAEISTSQVTGLGTFSLARGENKFNIVVTSAANITRTYHVTVNRAYSSINTLDDLVIKNGNSTLSFVEGDFSPSTNDYTLADLPVGVENLTVIATKTDPDSTVVGDGTVTLVGDENVIRITVTSESGTANVYTVTVTRTLDASAYLTELIPSIGTLTPEFDYYGDEYTLHLGSNASLLSFVASTESPYATVTGLESQPVLDGTNDRIIEVRAEDGTMRRITIHVVKARTDEARLLHLTFGEYTFDPAFAPDTFSYRITVPFDKKILSPSDLVAEPMDPNATVQKQSALTLSTAKNNIYIVKVIAADGFTEETYTLNIMREKGIDATLSSLAISDFTIDPALSSTLFDYTVYVPRGTAEITSEMVTATATDPEATVEKMAYLAVTAEVDNIYTITVTSGNGSVTNMYRIRVAYALDTDGTLRSLIPSVGTLSPAFQSDIYSYTLQLNSTQDQVTFTAETNSIYSEIVAGLDPVNMNVLQKKHTIEVETESGDKVYYQVTIQRSSGTDANIKSLEIADYTFEPVFDPYTYEYTLRVPKGTTQITEDQVRYTLSDPYATIDIPDTFAITEDNRDYVITVTSDNGEVVQPYTFHIDYIYSSDATLQSLTPSVGTLSPAFDPNVDTYTLAVRDTQNSIDIAAEANDPFATVASGNVEDLALTSETTAHQILVVAEDGSTKTYHINIVKSITTKLYLENIEITGLESPNCDPILRFCQMSSVFDPETLQYSVTVPNDIDVLGMIVTKQSPYQEVTYTNVLTGEAFDPTGFVLEYGRNTFDVAVTNGLGQTTTYRYTINRRASENANLTNIILTNPDTPLSFDPNVIEYNVSVENEYTSIRVTATTEDPDARYAVYGNNDLWVGNNDVIVEVTAKSGNIKQYIIHVYRKPADENLLDSLTISTGTIATLEPAFNENTFAYTVHVGSAVTSITFTARAKASTTGVYIAKGTAVVPSDAKLEATVTSEFDLTPGVNTFEIVTVPAQGVKEKYVVNVIREESENVDLADLLVYNGTLSPQFSINRRTYDVTVGSDVTALDLFYRTVAEDATVKVRGNKNLVTGTNTVSIAVTSANKRRTQTYILTVTKEGSHNNYLTDIKADGTSVAGEGTFDKTAASYNISVPTEKDHILLEAVKEDPSSTVVGDGNHSLEYGWNAITIQVISEEGDANTYTVNVFREYNNYLSQLITDEGTLSPAFEKTTTEYTVDLPRDVEGITVLGIKENAKATLTGNDYYELPVGETVITIRVSSTPESFKEYHITVTRAADEDRSLATLEADEGTITQEGNPLEYFLTVPMEIESLHLRAEATSPNAQVTISGNENFQVCEDNTYCNTVTIHVKSEHDVIYGGAGQGYILHVNRSSMEESISSKLATLTVSEGTLSPTFGSTTYSYAVDVEKDISQITIGATSEESDSTVTGTGTFNLAYGINVFRVVVTNRVGNQHTYTITVTRALSDEARIESLTFDQGTLNEVFDKDDYDYTMHVDASVISLNETVTLVDPLGRYTITGHKNLSSGENTITITTTSPSTQVQKTYTILVTKGKESDNTLATLQSNIGTLTPTFTSANTFYTLNVPYGTNSIVLSGTTTSAKATVTGLGLHNLTSNNEIINIAVTPEEGETKTYTVTVVRALNNNADLKALSVKEGDLSPAFGSDTTSYTLSVDADVESVEITAVPDDPAATIVGDGVISIEVGENIIPITVRAQDGTTKTYTITVTRAKEASAKISSLSILNGTITPSFDKDTFQYLVDVPGDVESLLLDYTLEDSDAASVITGNSDFRTGDNLVTITVTNGALKEVYTFRVNKQVLSNNYLNDLYTDVGELTPTFESSVLNYTVAVDATVDSISIFAEANDSAATITGTGMHTLSTGDNVFEVVVTSRTSVSRTYTITVTREPATENKLLTLSTSTGDLSPLFQENHKSYTLTVPAETTQVTLTGNISARATVVGLGDVTLNPGTTRHLITVTSESGVDNVYVIEIYRPLSTNATVTNITPSVGELDPAFANDTKEYNMVIGTDADTIDFTVETESSLATVTGDKNNALDYGMNEITVTVTAEDGMTTNVFTFHVYKTKLLTDIVIPESLTIAPGETGTITVEYLPADTDQMGVDFRVLGTPIVTVDENGVVTSDGTVGVTTILVSSKHNPSIQKTIQINVEISEIDSDVYVVFDANHYIAGMEPKTTVTQFVSNLKNEAENIRVYKADGTTEVTGTARIGTGYIVKLEANGNVYEELTIVVKGDCNGDGLATIADITMIQNVVGRRGTFNAFEKAAADVNEDGRTTVADMTIIQNLVGRRIRTITDALFEKYQPGRIQP